METVLLVDDDPAVREIFCVFLEREGFSALAVSGGAECLDLMKTLTPDLVLLDMMMVPMDGWDTLLAIRHNPQTAAVPIIIVTGKHPTHPDILRYGGLIEDFVMKPVEFHALSGVVRRAITRSRDLQAVAEERQGEGHDPVLIAEYLRLGRMVRIAKTLATRFKGLKWVDMALLDRQERELLRLHTKMGFPDRVLVCDAAEPAKSQTRGGSL